MPRPRRPPRPNWPTPTSRRWPTAAATGWWRCTFRRRCREPTAPRSGPRPTSIRTCGSSTRSRPRWAPALSRWPPRGRAFVVVHRLDNLRRSGRIGGAKAWLGTALALKPLLRIDDGKLVLAQRVRTITHATATMIDRVCEVVGEGPAALAVHHVANPDGANEVAAALAERLPACEPAIITPLGPVLALHVGGGAVAVCLELPES